jgi:hypothetical protein
MIETSNRPKRRIILLIWMVLSQLLAVATLFIWIFVIGAIFIIAIEAKTVTAYWIQAIVASLYPVFPLTLITGAWIAYLRYNNRMAAFLSGMSFVLPVPVLYFLMNI